MDGDDEQVQIAVRAATIPARTKRYWRHVYQEAETRYGSGYIGLIPHFTNSGGTRKMAPEVLNLVEEVLTTHYDTVTRKPKRGAYGEYLKQQVHVQLTHPRRIVAFYLTFDPPSYRSCMMGMRLCVKRYGRLPTAITVDGGPEFRRVYFEQLLALYRVRKHQRPSAEPRFGSPLERLFGTMDTTFIYHLLGNTQATKQPRTMTKATDPGRHAVWTLASLADRVQQWADEEYDTMRHPALRKTPREAYEQSLKRDGERDHKRIPYDDVFVKATFPSTRKGTALVQPGIGVMRCATVTSNARLSPCVTIRLMQLSATLGFVGDGGNVSVSPTNLSDARNVNSNS